MKKKFYALILAASSLALIHPASSLAASQKPHSAPPTPQEVKVPTGLVNAATNDIVDLEYKPSVVAGPDGRSLIQAPNRSNNIRTWFKDDEILLEPRTGDKNWDLGFSLKSWGRPGSEVSADQVSPVIEGNRVEYRRNRLTEWYLNESKGLEQGFDLDVRPGGSGNEVVLAFADDEMTAEIEESGNGLVFRDSSGDKIRLDKLFVEDSLKQKLPARFEAREDGFAIIVDDSSAAYPIHIDPVFKNSDWSDESDQANSLLGFVVAGAGDVNGDGFDDIIVGAHYFDNGQTDEGKVFAYYGSATGLGSTYDWSAESDVVDARFGQSVAGAGDVNNDGYDDVIVGAANYTNGEDIEGAAYVFYGSSTGLLAKVDSPRNYWMIEPNLASSLLGSSVDGAGDVDGDGYDDIVIGAQYWDNGQSNEGRAFVYYGGQSGISTRTAWHFESNQAGAEAGKSVAGAGDVNNDGYDDVLVGAWRYDGSQAEEGRVWVFLGASNGLATSYQWFVESDQTDSRFGWALAGAGDFDGDGYDDVAVGAPYYDNGQADEGAVFVYYGPLEGLDNNSDWKAEGNQAGAFFGISVDMVGKFRTPFYNGLGTYDGDGRSDLIVGATGYDNGNSDEGRAYLYMGRPCGLMNSPEWIAESNQTSAQMGRGVAGAGDIDHDGNTDVIVGVYTYDNGQSNEGGVNVYYGEGRLWNVEGDADQDEILDVYEAPNYGTDPENDDYDGDNLIDGFEVYTMCTDPLDSDTDGDGWSDDFMNPNGDKFPTNPAEWVDTDNDRIGNNADTDDDGDMLLDVDEIQTYGTNPLLYDTDGDMLEDGWEVIYYSYHGPDYCNPLDSDTDNDGLLDGYEVLGGMSFPCDSDSDDDGLYDGYEVSIGTYTNDPDTDDDCLIDSVDPYPLVKAVPDYCE